MSAPAPQRRGVIWQSLRQRLAAIAPAWRRFRYSVQGRVIGVVLLCTIIATLVAGLAMASHDLTAYRRSWASDLSTQADILALSTAPALVFDDRETATRNLDSLQARHEVRVAALYSTNGTLYARFVRPGAPEPPAQLLNPVMGAHISGGSIDLIQPIVQKGERLGTIYLRAQYDLQSRIDAYLSIFALVIVLSVLVALALSTLLQRVITAPLDAMADVARRVIEREDYTPRAQPTRDQEIGVVVEAFNRMLDEVQQRTRALQTEVRIRQLAETALGRANARLESTMAAAEIGSWVWDLVSHQVTADRNLAALYGLTDEKALSGHIDILHARTHPEDRAMVAAAEKEALRTGVLSSTAFRISQPDGSVRWVAARGKVQFDAADSPALLAGLLIDLTAQKLAERALRTSENRYRAIGESIEYGVWVSDAEGRTQYASESFLRLTGLTMEQCALTGWSQCLHPEDAAATAAAWQECVRSGGVWYREHRIRGADGKYHAVLAQGVPIRGEDGQITGWAGLNLDITRLKRTEEALREADRRKDEFLATLAHELRNPLAPIRHAVKLLELPGADERQRQWGRDVIARQVQRMALLLDDLLDVSRISRGRFMLKKGQVELRSLIGLAVETARPLIEAKQHRLHTVLPPERIELEVDSLRISQALSNLLTNSAKYTDAGGQISLTAQLQGAALQFIVEDTGIGLSEQAIPGLFEMFSQVESAVDRAEGGLGIGLALVKGLVELHGGSVEAHSAGLGQGSRFVIHLPSACVMPSRERKESRPATTARRDTPRCRVLVADDNEDAADSLALVLEMTGYTVHVAHSGSEALEIGERLRPEAFILDIGMPGLSGHEVARRIRQEPWGREALLLAITGWGQEEDKARTREAGFDHHLTKPVHLDQLEELLSGFALALAAGRGSNMMAPVPANDQERAG